MKSEYSNANKTNYTNNTHNTQNTSNIDDVEMENGNLELIFKSTWITMWNC